MLFARLPPPIHVYILCLYLFAYLEQLCVRSYIWFTSSECAPVHVFANPIQHSKSHSIRVPFRYKIFFIFLFPFRLLSTYRFDCQYANSKRIWCNQRKRYEVKVERWKGAIAFNLFDFANDRFFYWDFHSTFSRLC